jgi:hypothetical protein
LIPELSDSSSQLFSDKVEDLLYGGQNVFDNDHVLVFRWEYRGPTTKPYSVERFSDNGRKMDTYTTGESIGEITSNLWSGKTKFGVSYSSSNSKVGQQAQVKEKTVSLRDVIKEREKAREEELARTRKAKTKDEGLSKSL